MKGYIQKCYEARIKSAKDNYGHYPDYILVHPAPFQNAVKDMLPEKIYAIFQFGNGIEKMWGMKVIETTAIDEEFPVCLIEKIKS